MLGQQIGTPSFFTLLCLYFYFAKKQPFTSRNKQRPEVLKDKKNILEGK
jgi:hypothetical protein